MINATKAFKNDINIEFCTKESKKALSLRVLRGELRTEACGSGACAAVVSRILNGFLSANELIEVKCGGSLFVKWDGDLLFLFYCRDQQPRFSTESFMYKAYQILK